MSESRGMSHIVTWGSTSCQATHQDALHLKSSQEEADTKMLLHAVDAASIGAAEINICSPDTDVFILSLRRYIHQVKAFCGCPQHYKNCSFFHALSSAEITGSFSGKGKKTLGGKSSRKQVRITLLP